MEGRLYREDFEARRPQRLLSQTQESGFPSPPPARPPHHSPLTQTLASSGKCLWAPQQWGTVPQVGYLLGDRIRGP